jgi:hypothetical protein
LIPKENGWAQELLNREVRSGTHSVVGTAG